MKEIKLEDLEKDEDWRDILLEEERLLKEYASNYEKREIKLKECFLQLKNLFNLNYEIKIINGFDNSHFGGKDSTGVSVQWENGEFIKDEYRRYNFKIANSQDDHGMMLEILTRRLREIEKNNLKIDFFIIDGGKIQMSAMEKAILETGVDIPYICIKKGEKRDWKNDTFIYKDIEIRMNERIDGLKLLQSIRDEAHRFAGKISAIKKIKEIEF